MANYKFVDKLLEKGERVDRSQLEGSLRTIAAENILFGNVLEALDIGIVILDKNSSVYEINPAAEYLLGVSASKMKGKNITASHIDSALLNFLEKSLVTSSTTYQQEIHTSFPREQLLRVAVSTIKSKEVLGWIISINDITEFSRLSAQKAQNEKLKALVTMAGVLAHELGNPLNSLSIHIQLVNRFLKTMPAKYKNRVAKLLKVSQSEVKRLDDIVTRFLQATRPLKPRFFEGDINRILDDTLELLGPELKKTKVSVKKYYDNKLSKIYVDHIQIRQAFINIIKNAIEAMTKNGKLEIRTHLDGSRIKISFKDNGVGISEDELGKIFEPYYTTKRNGSGLGLVSVHRIVRDHGGNVEIKSKLWEGTIINLYLPIEPVGPKLLPDVKK